MLLGKTSKPGQFGEVMFLMSLSVIISLCFLGLCSLLQRVMAGLRSHTGTSG